MVELNYERGKAFVDAMNQQANDPALSEAGFRYGQDMESRYVAERARARRWRSIAIVALALLLGSVLGATARAVQVYAASHHCGCGR
jgi:hypothetical protein